MAQGRVEHLDRLLWNHTAEILAMQINTTPFRKASTMVTGEQLNPYAVRSKPTGSRTRINAENLGDLTAAFKTE